MHGRQLNGQGEAIQALTNGCDLLWCVHSPGSYCQRSFLEEHNRVCKRKRS